MKPFAYKRIKVMNIEVFPLQPKIRLNVTCVQVSRLHETDRALLSLSSIELV